MTFVSFTIAMGAEAGSSVAIAARHVEAFYYDVAYERVRIETLKSHYFVQEDIGVVTQRLEEATQPPAQPAPARPAR